MSVIAAGDGKNTKNSIKTHCYGPRLYPGRAVWVCTGKALAPAVDIDAYESQGEHVTAHKERGERCTRGFVQEDGIFPMPMPRTEAVADGEPVEVLSATALQKMSERRKSTRASKLSEVPMTPGLDHLYLLCAYDGEYPLQ
ncbi:hypothetical protein TRAPUB_3663 [Trametes pubescens]|uniref:Uncharacterized protein n=1 Tax=Trametes pubescens TaxID=154538 RepID=A0A1M2VDB0_TRAPU|nr:hypothetical protein TRAPUB_3663 [Trametes pubescens]